MVQVHHPNHDHQATHDEDLPPAIGHRNTLPPFVHQPMGISSQEVDDFEELQMDHGGAEALAKEFHEEGTKWKGYVEWELYPEKCEKASIILKSKQFTPIPEFQLVPLPSTNPILLGNRWKEAHIALGPQLETMPAESWRISREEKSPNMLTVLDFPLNCEPRREDLMKSHITPNNQFYVRNHGGIPTIADEDFELEVGGLVGKPGKLTLAQLKDPKLFPQIEMPITLQCCGTRRVEQIALYPGEGDELLSAPWAEGAIGTAIWKGVSLKKVIKYFGGVTCDFAHVEGIGADTYFKKNKVFNYAVSVPYTKVKIDEVILAYEMNGEPLPKCHGGPLRMVVAGYIGARSTKWLIRVNVLAEPSFGPVQRQEYLYFNHQVGKHNSTYSRGFSIQEMPVASAILVPADMAQIVHEGTIECSGWAYSGGGHWIERVEVSADGGFTWHQCPDENLSPKYYHAMRLWKMNLPVVAEGWLEIVVRCWDNACNTQPSTIRDAWNPMLHVTSSAHRIKVYSANTTYPATKARLARLAAGGEPFLPITRPVEGIVTETPEEYAAAMAIKGPREPRC